MLQAGQEPPPAALITGTASQGASLGQPAAAEAHQVLDQVDGDDQGDDEQGPRQRAGAPALELGGHVGREHAGMVHAQRRRDQQQGEAVDGGSDPATQVPRASEGLDEALQGAGHEQSDEDQRQQAARAGLEEGLELPGAHAHEKDRPVYLVEPEDGPGSRASMMPPTSTFAILAASVLAAVAFTSSRSTANFGQGRLDLPAAAGDNEKHQGHEPKSARKAMGRYMTGFDDAHAGHEEEGKDDGDASFSATAKTMTNRWTANSSDRVTKEMATEGRGDDRPVFEIFFGHPARPAISGDDLIQGRFRDRRPILLGLFQDVAADLDKDLLRARLDPERKWLISSR